MAHRTLLEYYEPAYAKDIQRNKTPRFVEKLVQEAVNHVGSIGGKALDIGCGLGRNSFFMASHGFNVRAIDLSQSAVNYVQQVAKNEQLSIVATRGNVLREHFDNDFNIIVACLVLDEFNKLNAYWLVRRMQEMTAPGGVNCIITTTPGFKKGNMRSPGGHHFFKEDELAGLYTKNSWGLLICKTLNREMVSREVPLIRLLTKKPQQ